MRKNLKVRGILPALIITAFISCGRNTKLDSSYICTEHGEHFVSRSGIEECLSFQLAGCKLYEEEYFFSNKSEEASAIILTKERCAERIADDIIMRAKEEFGAEAAKDLVAEDILFPVRFASFIKKDANGYRLKSVAAVENFYFTRSALKQFLPLEMRME